MNPYLIAATAVAFAGQLSDCITTYIGIYVKKIAVEGDQAAIAQWIAKRPWALFTVKPLGILAISYALNNLVGSGGTIGTVFNIAGIGLLGVFAYRGFSAGYHNYLINEGK